MQTNRQTPWAWVTSNYVLCELSNKAKNHFVTFAVICHSPTMIAQSSKDGEMGEIGGETRLRSLMASKPAST